MPCSSLNFAHLVFGPANTTLKPQQTDQPVDQSRSTNMRQDNAVDSLLYGIVILSDARTSNSQN